MITMHPKILSKDGKPQFALLPYEEFLQVQAELARLAGTGLPEPRLGGFYDNLTAAEHAARQGVKPVTNLAELAWPGDPADWDGFDEAVNEWRYGKQAP